MITSRSNTSIKLMAALQSHRKHRNKAGRFVVEGVRLIEEALSSSQPIESVFLSPEANSEAGLLAERASGEGIRVELVSDELIQHISATETSSGILAILPFVELPLPDDLNFALVADRVSNPGNLGTLLRSAAAAGAQAVLLTEGTVDAYNPKVVRGAMGAHFHVAIRSMALAQLEELLEPLAVWIAEADGTTDYTHVNWTAPCAIVIGSEAHGPQAAITRLGNEVSIPLGGGVESLNAAIAGSILLFEVKRQRGSL